jgi:glutaredoxin-related protein
MKAKVNKELKQAMREESRRRRKRDRARKIPQLWVDGKYDQLGASELMKDMGTYGQNKR